MKTKRFFGAILLFILIDSVSAQGFGVDDTLKSIYKPTNSSTPPHEYFQLENFSDHAINMRWRVNQDYTSYPSQWQIALQDNITYHNPVIDSSDFILPDSAGTMDKIIINVYHNAYPGYGVFAVDLINLDSLDQVITIYFNITIYQANSIDELAGVNFVIFPNPSAEFIRIESSQYLNGNTSISLSNLNGQIVNCVDDWNGLPIQIPLNAFDSGNYFVIIRSKDSRVALPIILVK